MQLAQSGGIHVCLGEELLQLLEALSIDCGLRVFRGDSVGGWIMAGADVGDEGGSG